MGTRRRLALAAAVLAIIGLVLLLWRRSPKQTTEATVAAPAAPMEMRTPPAATPAPIQGSRDMGPPTLSEVKRQLEEYKAGAIYPHWSFPLKRDMKFLLEWNHTVAEDTLFGDDPDAGIFFRFDADRGHVMYG